MSTVMFELPNTIVLNLNNATHWRKKADKVRALRARGKAAGETLPAMTKAHALAVLAFPTGGRRDPHNWMPTLKALIDGLVDAEVLPDDDHRHLIGPDLRISDDRSPRGTVVVTLTLTEQEP